MMTSVDLKRADSTISSHLINVIRLLGSPMVIAMFGGMIGEGVMKKGKFGNQFSVQRSRDFQQRWAYYLESLRSRRYSK